MKSYHDSFDCQEQCEEFSLVTESDYDDVIQMLAEESQAQQGFGDWLDETERRAYLEQQAFEQKQSRLKDWLNSYSPNLDGDSYEGVAI